MSKSLALVDIQNDHFPGGALELTALEAAGHRDLVNVGAMSHMCIDATTHANFDLGAWLAT
jgi:nicotinamidase-related amidase